MDLQWLAIAVIVVSLPGAGWDLVSSRNALQREGLQSWLQLAWLGLLVGLLGLGVVEKWFGFSEALLLATLVTGAILVTERLVFRSHQKPRFLDSVDTSMPPPIPVLEPAWMDLGRSFFPVIVVVFVVRSFVAEPFKIPSGSMIPTLRVGDFILVNKFSYGLRLPVTNERFINVGLPQRGDVMVFRYPVDPSTDFIKRVVGVPGDVVDYTDKRLTINGQAVENSPATGIALEGMGEFPDAERLQEQLGGHLHVIQRRPAVPTYSPTQVIDFPGKDTACKYNADGFTCTVPPGEYFMMGDNRDSSLDSRYWGFVPDRNIVGRAFIVWWNFGELSRIGRNIP